MYTIHIFFRTQNLEGIIWVHTQTVDNINYFYILCVWRVECISHLIYRSYEF